MRIELRKNTYRGLVKEILKAFSKKKTVGKKLYRIQQIGIHLRRDITKDSDVFNLPKRSQLEAIFV